jgi:hypothetical protein
MKFTLYFPSNYNEITIKQYRDITALDKKHKQDIHKVMATIRILTNASEDQLVKITSKDILRIEKVLTWLRTPPQTSEVQRTFVMDEVEYGLVPDMENLSVGEFADLEIYCESADENMHKIMSVLYRPITRKVSNWYEVEPYKPTQSKTEAMLQAPFGVAVSLMVFFSVIAKESAQSLPQYLAEKERIQSLKNGDGTK